MSCSHPLSKMNFASSIERTCEVPQIESYQYRNDAARQACPCQMNVRYRKLVPSHMWLREGCPTLKPALNARRCISARTERAFTATRVSSIKQPSVPSRSSRWTMASIARPAESIEDKVRVAYGTWAAARR